GCPRRVRWWIGVGGTPDMVTLWQVTSEGRGPQVATLERRGPFAARVSGSHEHDCGGFMESAYGGIGQRLLRPRPHLASRIREARTNISLERVNAIPTLEPGRAVSVPRQSRLDRALLDCQERRGPSDVGISEQSPGTLLGPSFSLPCYRRRLRGNGLGLFWPRGGP